MQKQSQSSLQKIIQPIKKEFNLFEKTYRQQLESIEVIKQAFHDSSAILNGKRLRPILYFLSQGLLRKPELNEYQTSILIELVHLASLVHDDVVDGSIKRRGVKTINALRGNRFSVLVGDYLMAKVFDMMILTENSELIRILTRSVMDMTHGEIQQNIIGKNIEIGKSEYLQIIKQKSASLFKMACEMGCIVQKGNPDQKKRLGQLGEAFGIAFQIRDDILDYSGSPKKMGKPTGQDLSGGKITLPLILSINGASNEIKEKIRNSLSCKTDENKQWIIKYVHEHGGIQQAQSIADEYCTLAMKLLKTFKDSIYRRAFEKLITFGVRREQ